jgi:glycosyltransferase involved in cell wall biosynthesis
MALHIDVTDTVRSGLVTGIQAVVRGIAAGADAAGIPFHGIVWVPGRGFAVLTPEATRHALAQAGTPAGFFAAWLARRRLERLLAVAPLLSESLRPGDVIVEPEVCDLARTRALIVQRRPGEVALAAVLHDRFAEDHPEWGTPRRRHRHEEFSMLLPHLDRLMVATRWLGEDLASRPPTPPPPAGAVRVAPFGVARGRDGAARREGGGGILCVGTLEPRKNHAGLFDAMRILARRGFFPRLVLVGRAAKAWRGEAVAMIRELAAQGVRVEWLRKAGAAQLEACYGEALFTVVPSLAEGFGFPLYESLVRGVPCIANAHPALREGAEGGGCVLVDATRPEALADAMQRLLEDRDARGRLCREAADRVFPDWAGFVGTMVEGLPSRG